MKESGREGFVARSFVGDNARRWRRITPPLNGVPFVPGASFVCEIELRPLLRISRSHQRFHVGESANRDKGVARTTGEAKVLTTWYSRRDSPRVIRKVREDGFIFGAVVRVKSPRRIQCFRGIRFSTCRWFLMRKELERYRPRPRATLYIRALRHKTFAPSWR